MIPAARAALEAVGGATLLLTAARGDETRCTREAIERGATTIVVLGGDGTISQVACELVRLKSNVPLAIFGAGTGNDFAKSLAAPIHDYRAMTALMASKRYRAVDAGRIDDDLFLNSGGFGFDAEVVRQTEMPMRWRGKSVYTIKAIQQLFTYRGFDARISASANRPNLPRNASDEVDRTKVIDGHWLTMVFANGSWFGSSYRIAPEASISDGFLDAVLISDAPSWRRAVVFGRALRARHVGQREVTLQRNTRWVVDFPSPPVYQVDGELRQAASRSVVVEIVPSALRLVAQPVPSPKVSQY